MLLQPGAQLLLGRLNRGQSILLQRLLDDGA
jgi:hypothetical protein